MSDHKHKPQPINGQPSGLKIPKKNIIYRNWPHILLYSFISIVIFVFVSMFVWYQFQLGPVGSDKREFTKITIEKNSSSAQIGKQLEKQSIIRSSLVFDIYVRLSGKGGSLQAGTYRISPADSTPAIVEHFTKGSVDQFNIMFYPGATLTDSTNKSENSKQDVTSILRRAGYADEEITVALDKTYTGPLFDGKPTNADLEGYVYGDTYSFNDGATVEEILQRTFDRFYEVVKDNNLIDGFKKHGLNLYQAITLASIVQRESGGPSDRGQIAQVFYSRIANGMMLGSDVTYQYIADKTGVSRDPGLDSLYNTRRYAGLPPGPISSPGLSALKSVANPASGDYMFFLSGDDDVTYFARTNEEHEANIVNHCKVKCSTP